VSAPADCQAPAGYEAARVDAAWRRRPEREVLEVAGPDRVRFLHNLTTADVRALAPGEAGRAFVTTVQGRVVADADLLALAESILMLLPAGRSEAVAEHFGRYRIVERVEIAPRPDLAVAELRGPRAGERLAAAGLAMAPAAGSHAPIELGGATLRLLRRTAAGPRFEAIGEPAALALARAALAGAAAPLGLAELSPEGAEALRVEAGELAFGVDYGPDNFPQESGEAGAISYAKGCYLGQEVVARIHYRGGVQRLPRGLRFLDRLPEPGTPLLLEGREAGRATSVARSPRFGALGLALVHRRAGEPPARLELEGGGAVELAALPFG